jgi:hypothetical protein
MYATHGNEFSSDVGIERRDNFKTLFQIWDGSTVQELLLPGRKFPDRIENR